MTHRRLAGTRLRPMKAWVLAAARCTVMLPLKAGLKRRQALPHPGRGSVELERAVMPDIDVICLGLWASGNKRGIS